MTGGVLALMIAGLVGFGAGAYLAATGERPIGIMFMGFGLMFQVLTLRQLRAAKKDGSDAG
ncbi:hypothetical protein [Altererythrobacter sp.]|uniref:hypothetical protein n=1 Tax=Altererythrobacter sp. TaxID=1872480 RepID=UPI001B0F0D6C|nr:hypothetical protein [Altererythrobacter sp.]MBO6608250.1 hypothetical protein [Altererythrobacter sp.]MBO6641494.1 hypothetical protein [Altererythrobacter sp.]MBO6707807.1 hypothetical protein [Altererythrobacter sp.]MBO6946061.1 hypothetical protein [Altererythrobacter sp.]